MPIPLGQNAPTSVAIEPNGSGENGTTRYEVDEHGVLVQITEGPGGAGTHLKFFYDVPGLAPARYRYTNLANPGDTTIQIQPPSNIVFDAQGIRTMNSNLAAPALARAAPMTPQGRPNHLSPVAHAPLRRAPPAQLFGSVPTFGALALGSPARITGAAPVNGGEGPSQDSTTQGTAQDPQRMTFTHMSKVWNGVVNSLETLPPNRGRTRNGTAEEQQAEIERQRELERVYRERRDEEIRKTQAAILMQKRAEVYARMDLHTNAGVTGSSNADNDLDTDQDNAMDEDPPVGRTLQTATPSLVSDRSESHASFGNLPTPPSEPVQLPTRLSVESETSESEAGFFPRHMQTEVTRRVRRDLHPIPTEIIEYDNYGNPLSRESTPQPNVLVRSSTQGSFFVNSETANPGDGEFRIDPQYAQSVAGATDYSGVTTETASSNEEASFIRRSIGFDFENPGTAEQARAHIRQQRAQVYEGNGGFGPGVLQPRIDDHDRRPVAQFESNARHAISSSFYGVAATTESHRNAPLLSDSLKENYNPFSRAPGGNSRTPTLVSDEDTAQSDNASSLSVERLLLPQDAGPSKSVFTPRSPSTPRSSRTRVHTVPAVAMTRARARALRVSVGGESGVQTRASAAKGKTRA